ncbi:MAG: SDR family NAD(P)-dependent oxidoreductase [Acidimicrobiales bacterium]
MKLRLSPGTALVTGASSGIGRAFALGLAARGLDLVVVARRKDRLEELAAEVQSAHGRTVEVLPADLVDEAQRATVEARLADAGRPIDVLVNSAGFGTQGLFAELPVDDEDQEIRLNVLALVRLTHAALPGMIERRRGAVVNVTSLAGHQPIPKWATYTGTKAFVTTFTRAVAAEVHRSGVHVLLVIPGFTSTGFQEVSQFDRRTIPGPAWMTAEAVAEHALADLERGRKESIPGVHNRVVAVLTWLSPWPLTRRVLKVGTRKMM